MPNCTKCGTPLPKPINEYGPFDSPLCRSCFLTQEDFSIDPERELEALRAEIQDYNDMIKAKNLDIRRMRIELEEAHYDDTYESVLHEIGRAEDERDSLMQKRTELGTRQFNLIKAVKEERLREQLKLIRWTEGLYANTDCLSANR